MAHAHGTAAGVHRGRLRVVLAITLTVFGVEVQMESADRRRLEEAHHA